jgi:hypothetical protein
MLPPVAFTLELSASVKELNVLLPDILRIEVPSPLKLTSVPPDKVSVALPEEVIKEATVPDVWL